MSQRNKDIQILVVDDEAFMRNFAIVVLNKLGYENVLTASDGAYALGKISARENAVDVVVCDLNMPEVDGIEFIRLANEEGFKGALIFLSGEDKRMLETAHALAAEYQLNVLGALQKPLAPEKLQALLDNIQPGNQERRPPEQEPVTRAELMDAIQDTRGSALTLFYQPKINITSGEISGVEALARWDHPERGMLGPGTFIPLAEENGLVHLLTLAIYRNAVRQVAQWLQRGITLKTSVNFNINSFAQPDFSRFLLETAEEAGVSPELLTLEVTETQVMQNARNCREMMMRLRMKKFGLSIDDFGTGNSSLVQLKTIPFNELKIDRAFVNGAASSESARAILETSVDLGRKLDMQIVAEGTENRDDWDLLETLGVDYVQGFYCARPMANGDLLDFLAGWSGPH